MLSALTSSGSSRKSTLGLQDWRIHCNAFFSNFVTKNDRLGLVLLHTHTAGVLVPINKTGSKRKKKVYIS